MTQPLTSEESSPVAGEIVARRASYYRNTRIIVVLMVLGFGIAFLYDGFVRYPAYNDAYDKLTVAEQVRMDKKHQPEDIKLQQELASVLLPLGVLMIVWFLYNSRGAYRLAGNTLEVPGHPPIPLDRITDLDKAKWDRKGIAFVDYELATGEKGRARLDDFVYERTPTDAIVEAIELSQPQDEDVDGAEAADDTSVDASVESAGDNDSVPPVA